MAALAPTTAPLPPSQTAAAPAAAPISAGNANARGKTDLITFLASLDVQLPIVLEVVQEMLSLYSLWTSYNEPAGASGGTTTALGGTSSSLGSPGGPLSPSLSAGPDSPSVNSLFSNMPGERGRASDAANAHASVSAAAGLSAGLNGGTGNRATAVTAAWLAGSGGGGVERPSGKGNASGGMAPTLGDERAIGILARMRANREMDLAHPAHGGQAQQAPTPATSLAKA